MKLAAFLAGFILAIPLIGRAIDTEHARADAVLSEGAQERSSGVTSVGRGMVRDAEGSAPSESAIPLTATRYKGKTLRYWVKWGQQHEENSGKRGLTIRRLKRELRRGFIPSYWVAIASCESGVSWTYNGSSGFDGAVQFHPGTWSANRLRGYPAFAYQASPFQQLVVAEIVLARSGWGQWPSCSRKVGLR